MDGPIIVTLESGTHRTAERVARQTGFPVIAVSRSMRTVTETLDAGSSPRGYRILSRIPRLPAMVVDPIVTAFGRLLKVMAASIDDLLAVEGVGAARASSRKGSSGSRSRASSIVTSSRAGLS